MKKSNIKIAVKKAMTHYYKAGMTNTAHYVYLDIIKAIDNAYKKQHGNTK